MNFLSGRNPNKTLVLIYIYIYIYLAKGGNRSDCRFCVNHKTEFNTESEPSDRIEHSDNT